MNTNITCSILTRTGRHEDWADSDAKAGRREAGWWGCDGNERWGVGVVGKTARMDGGETCVSRVSVLVLYVQRHSAPLLDRLKGLGGPGPGWVLDLVPVAHPLVISL